MADIQNIKCKKINVKRAKSPKFSTRIGNRGRRIERRCLNLRLKCIYNRFCACAVQMLLTMAANATKCSTSLFPTRSHLSPNLAITISVSFALSVHTSILKQLPPLPLPLFTPSSTTATLFITTCPSLRSPGSNRSRTLSHVLLSKLPNPVTSLPSFGLCSG